ncbi:23S rRNA pseudouridine(1911/1915/1917) synthase RluD [Pseudocitrobacter faecalis]|nr:23S rRNA pseudouridine(1911/1915/1917) synthase RluD [Pseudocitrobacter faecalis]
MFPDYSRSRIKEWILDQRVQVNGQICDKPKEKVLGGEAVAINAEIDEDIRFEPQDIPLNIVYEDDDILVINKPRDLVVHPGAGNPDGTVLNALLHYYPPIADVPRAGIVHRLDKDTTGLMVVAKTVPAQTRLVESLQLREITREYEAVAIGHMTAGGTVEEPISRHPTKRTHMAVHPMGKPAVTHYRIMEHFRVRTRVCGCVLKQDVRTRSACTWPILRTRWWAIRFMAGVRVHRKARRMSSSLRCVNLTVRHCMPLCCVFIIRSPVLKWNGMRRFLQDMVDLIDAMRADFEEHKDDVDWL